MKPADIASFLLRAGRREDAPCRAWVFFVNSDGYAAGFFVNSDGYAAGEEVFFPVNMVSISVNLKI
jgi:hypothetical protein